MNSPESRVDDQAVIGQKHAFATASLLLGIVTFISLLGIEKGILAIIFGILALKAQPFPPLNRRRGWAKTGIVLGSLHVALVLVIVLVGWRVIMAMMSYAADVSNATLHGPKTVLSVPSPDGEYTAYVEDLPSIDPPNQALFVEHRDQRRFMHIADLAEDVDSIKQVVWSPDGRIVVFHSRDYLTATRVSDWQTIRIYLGDEWTRHQPGRRGTFSSGEPTRIVAAIEFDAPDGFSYRLQPGDRLERMNFSAR